MLATDETRYAAAGMPPRSEGARSSTGRWISLLAVAAATVPFLAGLSGSRVFYMRDLSMFFWGRHVSLRRELLSGTFPLWDPYVGAGQSAVADALRQSFLLPALAVRLLGNEVLGFNLGVAMPFPLAALGAWLFLRKRFSAVAAAMGAIAFSVSGPIVSTGNFPNMSWSVAAIPWVLWAADRAAAAATSRAVAVLAIVTALQALAGEPVTLLATLALAVAFVGVFDLPLTRSPMPGGLAPSESSELTQSARGGLLRSARGASGVGLGLALGLALAAIQLVPLAQAAGGSTRAGTGANDFWSLHPLVLLEVLALHLFGDYFTVQSLQATPWLPPLNSGREPFLFSLYFGAPLLALALFGLACGRPRRWGLFWTTTGAASLIGAFGAHTPIYPFLRDHLPLIGAFRFPAKYLVISSMTVAAGAAAAWDVLAGSLPGRERPGIRKAWLISIGTLSTIGAAATLAAGACMYLPQSTAFRLFAWARALGSPDPVGAAEFMFRTLPRQASVVLLLVVVAAVLLWLVVSRPQLAPPRWILGGLIVGDLIIRAWSINPTFSASYLAQPEWLSYTKADPHARIYIGSKRDGTLDAADLDSSGPIRNPAGLIGSASRAAVNGQLNFEPSAWRTREMISYDLPILWPRRYTAMTNRFLGANRAERDRLLDRTGVRYRILPPKQAEGRTPIVRIPYFYQSFLYDWGTGVAPRASVISDVRVVPDADEEIEALFRPGWDTNRLALVEREPDAAGQSGTASGRPSASIVIDGTNRMVVDATAGSTGGYLVVLDSYSRDWHATADGRPAEIVRANGLFRAVRLVPGHHVVEFVYRPRAFFIGLAISTVSSIAVLLLGLGWRPVARMVEKPAHAL